MANSKKASDDGADAGAKLKQALQRDVMNARRKKVDKLKAEEHGHYRALFNPQCLMAYSLAEGASPLHLLALAGSEALSHGDSFLYRDGDPLGAGFLEARDRAVACAALLLSHDAKPGAKDAVRAATRA